MNTKFLIATSSLFYGIIGIGLTFVLKEISEFFGTDITQNPFLISQLLGATYLGFAMLNWMTKNNLLDGIYSRPLALGKLAYFFISSFAIIIITAHSENSIGVLLALTIVYSVFTLFFGYAFMVFPSKMSSNV